MKGGAWFKKPFDVYSSEWSEGSSTLLMVFKLKMNTVFVLHFLMENFISLYERNQYMEFQTVHSVLLSFLSQ